MEHIDCDLESPIEDAADPAQAHLRCIEHMLNYIKNRQTANPNKTVQIRMHKCMREVAEDVCCIVNKEYVLYEARIDDASTSFYLRMCECLHAFALMFNPYVYNPHITLVIKRRTVT